MNLLNKLTTVGVMPSYSINSSLTVLLIFNTHICTVKKTVQRDLLTFVSCPVMAVCQSVMFWLSSPGWPVLTVLSRLSCHSYPASFVLSQLSCPCCHVLFVLSSLCSRGYPVLAILSWLSCLGYPDPAVLSFMYSRHIGELRLFAIKDTYSTYCRVTDSLRYVH
jgi:hypothetical protein